MSLSARVLSMLVRANGEQFSEGMRQVRKEVTDTKKAADEANKAGKDGPEEAEGKAKSWSKSLEEVKGKWSLVKEIVGQVTDVVGKAGQAMSKLAREDKEQTFAGRFEEALGLVPVLGQAFKAGQDLNEGFRDTVAWIGRANGASKEWSDSWDSVAVKAEKALKKAEELAAYVDRGAKAQAALIQDQEAVEDLRAADDFARKRLQIERDYQERKREIESSYKKGDVRIERDLGVAGERRQLELDQVAEEEANAQAKKIEEREKQSREREERFEEEQRRIEELAAKQAEAAKRAHEADQKHWADAQAEADRQAKAIDDELRKRTEADEERWKRESEQRERENERIVAAARKVAEERQKFADLVRGGATTASRGSDEEWRILMRDFGGGDIAKQQLDQQAQIAGNTKTAADLLANLAPVTAGSLDMV